jgi:predicted porin
METRRFSITNGVIALCLLSSWGGVRAQSHVTLYGVLDTAINYQSKSPQDKGAQIGLLEGAINNSMWGILGEEDVGGGYRVQFKLESGIVLPTGAIGNSNGNLFGRNAYVGIDGPIGTIRAGVQYSPFLLATYDTDGQGLSDQASTIVPYVNHIGISGIFTSNIVTYTTPELAGFTGSFMFGFGGVAGHFGAGKQESFSLKYKTHGLLAEIAYLDVNDQNGSAAQQGRLAGVSYVWRGLTVAAGFTNYRMPTATTIKDVNVYHVGATYLITPDIEVVGGVTASRDQDNSDNKSMLYGLGTRYYLSKRTTLYAQAGLVHNQGTIGTGVNVEMPQGLPAGTTVGVNFGIDHSF